MSLGESFQKVSRLLSWLYVFGIHLYTAALLKETGHRKTCFVSQGNNFGHGALGGLWNLNVAF